MQLSKSSLFVLGLVALAPACHRSSKDGSGAVPATVARATSVPELDPLVSPKPFARVAELGALGEDWVLQSGGWLVEHPDGSARLSGVIRRRGDPKQRFQIDLELRGRLESGDPARPDESALDLDLAPQAYAANGGPVDPAAWTLYADVEGRLIGLDVLGGARIAVLEAPGAWFQVGAGASQQSVAEGLGGRVELTVLAQPGGTDPFPFAQAQGALAFTLCDRERESVVSAPADPVLGVGSPPALAIDGIGSDFAFVAGGEIVEHDDGTANLCGVVARASAPDERFFVDLALSARTHEGQSDHPPAGGPALELAPEAYLEQGGDADPSTWHYYGGADGVLVGLERFAGARLALAEGALTAQVGVGANGRNVRYGARIELAFTALAQPAAAPALPAQGSLALRADLATEGIARVVDGGSSALELPGVGDDFVLVAGGSLVEGSNGTARLGGVLARASAPDQRFALDLRLAGRLDADQIAGGVAPELGLPPASYADAGGPADVALWHYYAEAEGRLVGLRDLEGAVVELALHGPALQVGLGANRREVVHGASARLAASVVSQPSSVAALPTTIGPSLLSLEIVGERAACARTPSATPENAQPVAFDLSAIGDFVFDGPAELVERADATATLRGEIVALDDPSLRFDVDLLLVGRVDVGPYGDVPAGSPHLEPVEPPALPVGDVIDLTTWRYYTRMSGRLNGLGALAGAEVRVWRNLESFQLGVGANGVDLEFGGFARLHAGVVAQPTSGPALPAAPFEGELRVEVSDDCP